jgi:hypothetical protein
MTSTPPEAWADLLEAIALLTRHPSDDISPFNCTHDQLTVMADPAAFTAEELARLEDLGFHASGEGTFCSYRFGSA